MRRLFLKEWVCSVLSAVLIMSVAGCLRKPQSYGKAIGDEEILPILAITAYPSGYDGKTVKVSGEIAAQCSGGDCFSLLDGMSKILVNMDAEGFAIPQKEGAKVLVEGRVVIDQNGIPSISATGVEM